MRIKSKYRNLINPPLAATVVAIASIAAILLSDFGPSNASQDRDTARMVTAAAVSRAGAIESPSDPSVSLTASPTGR
jgi:hypothetical protein